MGLGVDVNEIDGVDIGSYDSPNPDAAGLVADVDRVANSMPNVRTVLGPMGHTKSETYGGERTARAFAGALKAGHMNHFHITFYSKEEEEK